MHLVGILFPHIDLATYGKTQERTEIRAAPYIITIRCTEAASRNEREEIVITGRGIERLQGKGGVHVLLHYKRKKWHGIIQTGNLETKRSAGAGGTEKARCLQCAEDERENPSIVEMS